MPLSVLANMSIVQQTLHHMSPCIIGKELGKKSVYISSLLSMLQLMEMGTVLLELGEGLHFPFPVETSSIDWQISFIWVMACFLDTQRWTKCRPESVFHGH